MSHSAKVNGVWNSSETLLTASTNFEEIKFSASFSPLFSASRFALPEVVLEGAFLNFDISSEPWTRT